MLVVPASTSQQIQHYKTVSVYSDIYHFTCQEKTQGSDKHMTNDSDGISKSSKSSLSTGLYLSS